MSIKLPRTVRGHTNKKNGLFMITIFVNAGIGNDVNNPFNFCCHPRLFDEPLSIKISMGELLHYVIVHFLHVSLFPIDVIPLVMLEIKAWVNVTSVNHARNLCSSYICQEWAIFFFFF